ncbi:hypothetical protein [Chromobacterium violaceum]|uniref:hypothetical protein n=1 Tax=Chromobacterium violaceum TaxID=536 RepID=UPI001C8B56BB|nr:hypothetical protein [Chromobacterium violaceum]MBX9268758.1 hypothetical protein [Chromobacterium violaceum]
MSMKPWQLAVFTAIGTLIGKAGYDLIIDDIKNSLIPKGWVAGTFSTTWSWFHGELQVTRGWWYLYNIILLIAIIIATIWAVKIIGEFNTLVDAYNFLRGENEKLKEDASKASRLEQTVEALQEEIKSAQESDGLDFNKLPSAEKAVLLSIASLKNEGLDKILERWIYESTNSKLSRLQAENALAQLVVKRALHSFYSRGDRCYTLTIDGLKILAQVETH